MPKFEDYEIIKRFKSGAMGKTFLVKHKKTGVLYVMKRVDYSDEEDKKLADDEAEQMKRLNSRFTVKLICTFTDRMDLCLILEYCPGGDLRKFISELQKFPIKERIERVWNLMAQIAEALDFMHLNKVIHRDIKPENIFLMNDGSIRLGDFGLAKALTEKYYATVAGTKFYLAPEVWLQKIMTYLSDIYAFGVVTFELLAVHHPFLADNEQEMIEKIKKGESEQLPDWVPIKMKEQIMRMIDVDPGRRPSAKDIMQIDEISEIIQYLDDDDAKAQLLTLEKLKIINEEIRTIAKTKHFQQSQIPKLENGLKAVRHVRSGKSPKISNKIIQLADEILNNVSEILSNYFKKDNKLQISFLSTIVNEAIIIVKISTSEQISVYFMNLIGLIAKDGSSQQVRRIFENGIFQIPITLLSNEVINGNTEGDCLKSLIHIINKGWKFTTQSLSQQQYFNLQQLLSLPYPFQVQLEQQQIIQILIEEILMKEQVHIENKKYACELLDLIYPEGIKFKTKKQQEQIIKQLCEQTKSIFSEDNSIYHSIKQLSYIAINQDNHELIIAGNVIQFSTEQLRKKLEGKNIDKWIIKYSLLLIINLFLFGSQQTQQLTQNSISKETLNKLKDNDEFNKDINYQDQTKQLLSSYSDPNTMKELIRIRRVVERRNEEELIQLIKARLIIRIIEIIEKSIQDSDGEGKIIIIGEIIELLIKDNSEVSRIINGDKNNANLISQLVKKLLNSQDKNQIQYLIQIILNIAKAGLDELKEQQQHPFHQQLQFDGTIPKLIQIFKDEKDKQIHKQIAYTLSYLFKSLPLPRKIRNNVIEIFKYKDYHKSIDFYELSFLAECPDNHDAILANQFEMELFEDDKYTLEYLNLSIYILKYGSNINKLRVASFIKEKVEKLTNDKYVDELGNEQWPNWNQDKKQQIKSKSKELFQIIITIINDKNNLSAIFQFVNQIQDSENKDVRQKSIEIIYNFIKANLVGLEQQQQHPFHQQLQADGTIPKLIQIFQDYNQEDIHNYIQLILACLFKSLPFPPEIRDNIIDELKYRFPTDIEELLYHTPRSDSPDFDELSFLAECPDNHEAILSHQYEMKLFKDDKYSLEYINISLPILKYGSNINKLRVASFIKEKVEKLTNDKYVDELGNERNIKWNSDKKQEIKSKSKELYPIIILVINDKNNVNLISQLITQIQDSKDKDHKQYLCKVILNSIKVQISGLKERQQHPFHQQFQSDGTIPKLIQIFKDEKDEDIQEFIAKILAYLFKSLPLPPEIMNNVIEELKNQHPPVFIELSLLAECPDNHYVILANEFRLKLFKDDKYTLEFLNISLSILKYGSNINQFRVASFIKEKVEKLTNDKYVDELGNEQWPNWNQDKKQQIKSKSKELLPIIIQTIKDKNNINLISQLISQLQDYKDNNIRKDLIQLIYNLIIEQINGLKEGQQHPFHQQLQSNGTIPKLIEIFKYEKDKDIHEQIAQTLSYLFKSLPLPPEIMNNVIEQLKSTEHYKSINFYELSFLAECADNHDAILANQFEMKLFEYGYNTLEYLIFSLFILKYGSNINKLRVASFIKEKVEKLTNDKYVNELGNDGYNKWNEDKKQQIKSNAQELLSLINNNKKSSSSSSPFSQCTSSYSLSSQSIFPIQNPQNKK